MVCNRQHRRHQALRQLHGSECDQPDAHQPVWAGDNDHPTNSRVLPALIRRFHEAAEAKAKSVTCWGSGTPLHEFLHADDLGEASVFALEHWQPGPDGTPKKQLDVSRLASLGWRARIPLAEGLASTVMLFREQLNQQLVRL